MTGANPSPGQQAGLRLQLLGTFQVIAEGQAISGATWPLRKARSLIKLLALSPGRRLEREQIMGQLWPDLTPQSAGNNLRYALHVARRALPPQVIVSEGTTLALCPPGAIWVDVEAFETAAARAFKTRDPADFSAALDLYRGELLPEDRYEDWTVWRRETLRDLHVRLLLNLAAVHESSRTWPAAIATLQRLLAEDQTHEEGHTALMRLFALAGQRALALRQWDQLAAALRQHLDASPGAASRALRDEIAAGRFPPPAPCEALVGPRHGPDRTNLSVPLSSLIGREAAQVAVKEALAASRLVTLTGPGGCGKTRLGLAVATDLVAAYPDGAWLVDLAPLTDPSLVAEGIANVLALRELPDGDPQEALAKGLRERELLLMLDNCEHLVAACAALVATLLQACPRLRILATSREGLGVSGEIIWQVPSLSLPPADSLGCLPNPLARQNLANHGRVGAVRLFVDRARQRRADFALTRENFPVIAEICRRLDGIPLAIELAAARIGVLTVVQIATRLDDALGTLVARQRTGPTRQQTMRATLDWSYALLNETERALLHRLAVFAGGWTLDAAEAIWGEAPGEARPAAILDLLEGLTDKSLVVAEQRGESVRYRILEVVRQYAAERLAHDPAGDAEEGAIRQAHAAYYVALAERIDPTLTGPEQVAGFDTLETEHDNLRAALRWSLAEATRTATAPQLALRLGGALARFWRTQGYFDEGRRWLAAILQATPRHDEALSGRVLAKALNTAGVLALFQGDGAAARGALTESIALWRVAGDLYGAGRGMISLGFVEMGDGEAAAAAQLLDESVAIFRSLGDRQMIAIALDNLGFTALIGEDFARARRALEESVALSRATGNIGGIASALNNLGDILLAEGDAQAALRMQVESLTLAQESGATLHILWALEGLARAIGTREGSARHAARLYGTAETLRNAIGFRRLPAQGMHYERHLATARTRLDPATFDAAWDAGRTQPLESAIAEVLTLGTELSV